MVNIPAATLTVEQDESLLTTEGVADALQKAGFAVQSVKKIQPDDPSLKPSMPVP